MDSTTLSASACPATAAGTPTPGPHPRICNSENAHCLSCVYSTTGKHCEHCAEGCVGSAIIQSCEESNPINIKLSTRNKY
ncbi:laminin subunit beta-1-like [Oncorhynchus mykiss]|uniref:laminin subunit beta-1-like n=1 Tax=Oncorhynchus mykiss TaxID=8022 RepID=UPI0018775D5F|nr:laminin subunit beta-1-like [Oncorhynchus mykiss]